MQNCPTCGKPAKRISRRTVGEITFTVNAKTTVTPPHDVLTFYPCGHSVKKAVVK